MVAYTQTIHNNEKPNVDSLAVMQEPTTKNVYDVILDSNIFINYTSTPKNYIEIVRVQNNNTTITFYILLFFIMAICIAKWLFSKYVDTLFSVFFNTSLRQSQLTDQLTQAKLPSLIFNIVFVIVMGFYIQYLIEYIWPLHNGLSFQLLFSSIVLVAICYLVKYIILKFIGWATGYADAANSYIFIVFLLNKILGILLIPIVIVAAFSKNTIVDAVFYISFLLIFFFIMLRFLRSYAVLQHKLQVSALHFILYIIAIELLPLAVIYKTLILFFGNNA